MPVWMQAGLWGGVAGGALVLGAAVGYRISLPRKIIAGIMAFAIAVASGFASLAGYTVFS